MLKRKYILKAQDAAADAAAGIRSCEPPARPEGYAPGFPSGKDGAAIFKLHKLTEIKLTTYHSPTTIDPPKAVDFVRRVPEVVNATFDWWIPEKSAPAADGGLSA